MSPNDWLLRESKPLSQHRYRVNKVKRMHSIIDGVLPKLEELASHPGVDQVTPGRIRPTKRGRAVQITFQYFTSAGLKLLAHTPAAVQEVFVVSSDPQAVLAAMRQAEVIEAPKKQPPVERTPAPPPKKAQQSAKPGPPPQAPPKAPETMEEWVDQVDREGSWHRRIRRNKGDT